MVEQRGPEIPDGVELNKDGTVTITTDGSRCRLRRPKLGEFRKLRELLHEREDNRLRILAEQAAVETTKPEKDEDAETKLAYTLEVARRGRAVTDAMSELNITWLSAAIDMLAKDSAPAVDDWPSGMDSSEFVAALVDHWRAVPLRSGGA